LCAKIKSKLVLTGALIRLSPVVKFSFSGQQKPLLYREETLVMDCIWQLWA